MPSASPPSTAASPRILLWLVAVGFFMQTLDGTIVNTALPAMATSLGESPLRMQAVVVAYMLTMAQKNTRCVPKRSASQPLAGISEAMVSM